jgi:L-alanine-DL-glutamate epimerase-like enolase superfamily enzyme
VKITRVETFILHVPVTGSHIADSTHSLTHWGAPGVILHTDTGLTGYGYTGTHAHLAGDRLITDCISECYAPLLIGEDPREVQRLWRKLYHHPPLMWIGRSGITQLALAAVDVALWDLKAKAAEQQLWKLLGANSPEGIEAYNTDGGWLDRPMDALADNCRRLVEEDGYRAVKIKVGLPDPLEDVRRIAAVRAAIGPNIRLMTDANGRWDLPTALRMVPRFADHDVYWFEEPLWYDDVAGHRALAAAVSTPVALGEQLYSLDAFQQFIQAEAVHYVQPDAVRLGGITEWWQVADLAHARRLPVAPHLSDMGQIHLHLSLAHPACHILEYIPWLRDCFTDPITVQEGRYLPPQEPGAGTTLRPDALEHWRVA